MALCAHCGEAVGAPSSAPIRGDLRSTGQNERMHKKPPLFNCHMARSPRASNLESTLNASCDSLTPSLIRRSGRSWRELQSACWRRWRQKVLADGKRGTGYTQTTCSSVHGLASHFPIVPTLPSQSNSSWRSEVRHVSPFPHAKSQLGMYPYQVARWASYDTAQTCSFSCFLARN